MVTSKRPRKSKSAKATVAPAQQVSVSTDFQEAIRSRAYSIYEQRGREHGHDLDDWLIAEAEVVGKAFAQSA
jgi:predicted ribonuclease toxin of YeeF-YezG toxin-antitoxin module